MCGFIMACIELLILVKTLYCTENQGFGYQWLSKQIPGPPPSKTR